MSELTSEQLMNFLRCCAHECPPCSGCAGKGQRYRLKDGGHCETTEEIAQALLAHIDALTAENERLRGLLEMCRLWVGTGNPTADYEAFAEAFYRDTHMLAPGKSEPLGMGGLLTTRELQKVWDEWVEAKRAEILAALEPTP
jgi:hypothetical protein